MIRLGIIGAIMDAVQLPALRPDPRCQVVALAVPTPRERRACSLKVYQGYGDWRALVEDTACRRLPSPPAEPAGADRHARA
jgi:predicted dehydrogenase